MIIGVIASQPLPHRWRGVSPLGGRGGLGAASRYALANISARLAGIGRTTFLPPTIPLLQATAQFVGSGRMVDTSSITQDYYASAVFFDGSSSLQRNGWLTGVGAFNKFIFSVWIKLSAANNGIFDSIAGGSDFFEMDAIVNGGIYYPSINIADSFADTYPNTPGWVSTTWQHLLVAVDISAADGTAPNFIKHFYMNGTEITGTVDDDPGFDNSVTGLTDFFFGASGVGIVGDVADMQLWIGAYLDFSIAANRELFILAGRPVNPLIAAQTLGSPTIRFQGNAANFSTNQGTGGPFTVLGALANSTSSPSPRIYSGVAIRAGTGVLSVTARLRMIVTRTFAGAGNLSVNGTIV